MVKKDRIPSRTECKKNCLDSLCSFSSKCANYDSKPGLIVARKEYLAHCKKCSSHCPCCLGNQYNYCKNCIDKDRCDNAITKTTQF